MPHHCVPCPLALVLVLAGTALPVDGALVWDGSVEPADVGIVVNDPDPMRLQRDHDELGPAPGLSVFDTTTSSSGVNTRLMLADADLASELNRADGWSVAVRYKPLARVGGRWGNMLTIGDDAGTVGMSFDVAGGRVEVLDGHGAAQSVHPLAADAFVTIRAERSAGSDTIGLKLDGRSVAVVRATVPGEAGRHLQLGDAGTGGWGAGVIDYIAINAPPGAAFTNAPDRQRAAAGVEDPNGWRELRPDRGSWSNVGGTWQRLGFLTPRSISGPTVANTDCVAIRHDVAFADLEAEFRFRIRDVFGSTGFVFRARDASHYYLVHFPMIGQQQRAKHFWAAVSKVGDTGWVEVLHMQIVPGVPSELVDRWHHARVVARGPEIRVWVDGRPLAPVRDDAYERGAVGLASWTHSARPGMFADVRVRGTAVEPAPWDDASQPPRNWFHPYPGGSGAWQHALMCMTRAPGGDLLMIFADGSTPGISRSTDNGRTWGELEVLDAERGDSVIHATRDGRLLMQRVAEGRVLMSESTDAGRSWSDWTVAATGPWPADVPRLTVWSPSPLVELDDGTLLRFLLGHHSSSTGENVYDWGSLHTMAYAIRSTDGGAAWTAPTSLDGAPGSGLNLDLTEPVAAQLPGGEIVCYIRPIYSPFAWETRSADRAVSWGPTARGPFPSYASSLLCTRSGVLVLAGRFPGQGMHVSRDGGLSWRSHRIDETVWANGTLFEVEPDVVLYVYMTRGRLRGQFIRLTADGAEPVRPWLRAE